MTLRARLTGAWALMHPGPSLVTVVAYVLCVLIASHGAPNMMRLVSTTLGMLCMQFAISALNDYCDRVADAGSDHKRKPIPAGLISPAFAVGTAIVFAALMVALYLPFGSAPTVMALAFLALGFAYDLGIKSTPFSGVMLGLAFPIIPLLAWQLFAQVKPALGWTFALGMALGIAIHLADALPDRVADEAAGVRGLTQALGQHALATCWGALGVAIALVAVLTSSGVTPARTWIIALTIGVAVLLVLSAVIRYRRSRSPEIVRLKRNGVFVISTALVIAVGWLAGAVV